MIFSRATVYGLALTALTALASGAAPASAQEPSTISEAQRFEGAVEMLPPEAQTFAVAPDRMETLEVEIRNITLAGGAKMERIRLKGKAALILQLRGGELVTVIDGERRERREGEFWTVSPDQSMAIETEDDSAVVSVIAIYE